MVESRDSQSRMPYSTLGGPAKKATDLIEALDAEVTDLREEVSDRDMHIADLQNQDGAGGNYTWGGATQVTDCVPTQTQGGQYTCGRQGDATHYYEPDLIQGQATSSVASASIANAPTIAQTAHVLPIDIANNHHFLSGVSANESDASPNMEERVGDVTIEMLGHQIVEKVTVYNIKVSTSEGSHVVQRRYNEFAQLHHELYGEHPKTNEQQAAEMPPKSFWRKNFSRGFRQQREKQLTAVATAALAHSDTDHCPPALRRFLELPPQRISSSPTASSPTKHLPIAPQSSPSSPTTSSPTQHLPISPAPRAVRGENGGANTVQASENEKQTYRGSTEPADVQRCQGAPEPAGAQEMQKIMDRIESFIVEPKAPAVAPAAHREVKMYVADNSQLQAKTKGLAFRDSKDLKAKVRHGEQTELLVWGGCVVGVEEDGWILAKSRYLPMSINSCQVLKTIEEVEDKHFEIKVEKGAGNLALDVHVNDKSLSVVAVNNGVVSKWNCANPAAQVQWGDLIVAVDGLLGDSELLCEKIKAGDNLKLTLRRGNRQAKAATTHSNGTNLIGFNRGGGCFAGCVASICGRQKNK